MNKKILSGLSIAFIGLMVLAGCTKKTTSSEDDKGVGKMFSYETVSFTPTYGTKTNDETHDYTAVKVNALDNALRSDFAYGVDASMVQEVENDGGVYYNKEGKEQDVFQILRTSGVNFVRFRLWNKPTDKYGRKYGGGNNDLATDVAMAKRARSANMNVLIDFHYSDFWADPDKQFLPKDWGTLESKDIPNAISEYTESVLKSFSDAGVTVAAVQIGNEINNGMAGYSINWNDLETSFDYMASMLSAGIAGAKKVFPHIRTMIHLANGGNKAEFETFFSAMNSRSVDYDIVGASYYPYLSGSMSNLQANLDNIATKIGKPVVIAETSWGYTTAYNDYTANQYTTTYEDSGGYLTNEQAQCTEVRDVINVLSNVPSNGGLGIFYWEPGWLPVSGTSWATIYGKSYTYYGNDSHSGEYKTEGDGLATWSNQGLFSYTGKALSSLDIYKYIQNGGVNQATETSLRAHESDMAISLNLAADETLPTTGRVETDFEAIRSAPLVWTEASVEAVKTKGIHSGLEATLDGKYAITATATCIENYVVDPSFENQGETDTLKTPWVIDYVTPSDSKVVKLDRKTDTRSGTTDLNWYHSTANFTFKIHQSIASLPAGTYDLSTYILAPKTSTTQKHTKLNFYISVNGTETTFDALPILAGWSAGYQEVSITGVTVAEGDTVEIGIVGAANATAWAHNDDWSLVRE